MPPPIFTDAYIRKMCPENHPIPLAKIPTMGVTKPPQYLAKGYTGIKYVPPPHRPPRTVHTLATMMAGTSEPEAVRSQAAVIENFLTQSYQTANDLNVEREVGAILNEMVGQVEAEGEEETKAEVEVDAGGSFTRQPEMTPAQMEERAETKAQFYRSRQVEKDARDEEAMERVREAGVGKISYTSPAKTRSQASELITPASAGKSPMRRGRKPGSKNRSKVEIEGEKRQRQKNIEEGQRAEEAYRKQNLRGGAPTTGRSKY